MSPPLFVALCTHQPRTDYLAATMAALRAQTLPLTSWRLLVVDNASIIPLADTLDLGWHPAARIVREEKLGTAHARHRALDEARAAGADLILFVDDDNLLAPDYLATGIALGESWPQLGAWGGQLLPEFETEPPRWIGPYLKYLAIMPLAADRWTNHVDSYDAVPPSAGCFLRAAVVARYLELLAHDPRRLVLGARGGEQVRGEDTDLVLSALDLGLGLGRFRRLRLDHLVPRSRLTPAYVANVVEGVMLGTALLEYLRFSRLPRRSAPNLFERAVLNWRTWRLPEPLRSIRRAELRGRARARRLIRRWHREAPPALPAVGPTAALSV